MKRKHIALRRWRMAVIEYILIVHFVALIIGLSTIKIVIKVKYHPSRLRLRWYFFCKGKDVLYDVKSSSVRVMVEPGGVEPPSKNPFLSASPSADSCLKFPNVTDKYQTVKSGSSYFMTTTGTNCCSRSPLNDALAKSR